MHGNLAYSIGKSITYKVGGAINKLLLITFISLNQGFDWVVKKDKSQLMNPYKYSKYFKLNCVNLPEINFLSILWIIV